MKHSRLFSSGQNAKIEEAILGFLNGKSAEFSGAARNSPRAVGDIAQALVSENFESIAPGGIIRNYSSEFARRAMADLAFEDLESFYYVVDVKTHRKSSKFNMPNLTSVERLARFYEDDKNYFIIMMLVYDVAQDAIRFDRISFIPIEFLGWDCLTLGALGWGQIQIANSNNIVVNPMYSRRTWMIEMSERVLAFYPREIEKIAERISHFERVKSRWEAREE